MAASSPLHWFKSSYSGGSGTECVECACTGDHTLIRDSKLEGGPAVRLRLGAWRVFIDAVVDEALG
ncbi:DUF397 domain-containing protein [Streptomyces sp. NPDC001817]|uniref:DUF397 domain-containing protein n=1 Tax=Streptomyces sp. NPDC001817 TaxID=3154398 RepID=UPI00332CC68C